MELKHIELTPEMRQRLETAMADVIKKGRKDDKDYVLAAFSSAILKGSDAECKEFGLAPLTKTQLNEAANLESSILTTVSGRGRPAIVVSNLPHAREDVYALALEGLSLSINSGRKNFWDENPNENELARNYYTGQARYVRTVSRT